MLSALVPIPTTNYMPYWTLRDETLNIVILTLQDERVPIILDTARMIVPFHGSIELCVQDNEGSLSSCLRVLSRARARPQKNHNQVFAVAFKEKFLILVVRGARDRTPRTNTSCTNEIFLTVGQGHVVHALPPTDKNNFICISNEVFVVLLGSCVRARMKQLNQKILP